MKIPTPYADKTLAFQAVLEAYAMECHEFARLNVITEEARLREHDAKVAVMRLYNDVLSELQAADKGCAICKIDLLSSTLLSFGATKRVLNLCPNHSIVVALENEQEIGPVAGKKCLVCAGDAVAQMHDFLAVGERRTVEYHLCREHFVGIELRNLKPKAVQQLRKHFNGDTFLTHDDFYDGKGNAVQPKR